MGPYPLDRREPGRLAGRRVLGDEMLALAQGHIVLALPPETAERDRELGRRLSALADAALAQGRKPAAWRAAHLASRLFSRIGDASASHEQARAAQLFEEVKMNTPTQYRSGLDRDPDAPSLGLASSDARTATALLVERAARARADCAASNASTSASTAICAWRECSKRSSTPRSK